jgi:hypothetical protein
MGIYTAAGVLAYKTNGASLNHSVSLNDGTYNASVVAWDNCGGSYSASATITAASSSTGGAANSAVTLTSPANNATVASPVQFAASASSTCAKGVGAMGIYTAPGQLVYQGNGSNLSQGLPLNNGTYNATVVAWDNCGGSATAPVTFTVANSDQSAVSISSPANNNTVGSPVQFTATGSSTCASGVAQMGIYTSPGQLAYHGNGANLNQSISLSNGTYNATVVAWDNCGGSASAPVTFTVAGGAPAPSPGTSLTNLQSSAGWTGYGQMAPDYQDCNAPCPGLEWSLTQNVSSPSKSGSSAAFWIGGTTPYSDVMWNNHLIGTNSSQGLPDSDHSLVPSLYNFTYDVDFYATDFSVSQAMEFDINQYLNSQGYVFGTECRIASGNEWDVWDNVNKKWAPTGVACNPVSNSWNHVTVQVQRTSDGQLLYQSITLNGVTSALNLYYPSGSVPSDWYGLTVNFQLDGNSQQAAYTVYADNLTLTYW